MELEEVGVFIQARSGSTRFPEKILQSIEGTPMIIFLINRLSHQGLFPVVLTTENPNDDNLCALLNHHKVPFFRGDEHNVLSRFYHGAKARKKKYLVRITADCPLLDPKLVNTIIKRGLNNKLTYISNTLETHYPDGQDVEFFTFKVLEMAYQNANLLSEKEHVTPWILKNINSFKSDNLRSPNEMYGKLRMTVDEKEDLEVIKKLVSACGPNASWKEYADYLIEHPEIRSINKDFIRNEGYKKSIENEK